MNLPISYTGKGERTNVPLKGAWDKQEPYIPAPSLVDAVNTALYLRRPLLLEGEPGGGKTRLAFSVAYELGYPLYECYIRSTSRAQDLLYEYDALGRLYDIQEAKAAGSSGEGIPRKNYVTYGGLGQAIIRSANESIPSVVLIDEIDKADIDFPNDLLWELDRLKFEVKEVSVKKDPSKSNNSGEGTETEYLKYDAFQGKERDEGRSPFLPLIIVTSNREKELPKPFLRRCLFYYIEFPEKEELVNILTNRFKASNQKIAQQQNELFGVAVERFWELRSKDLHKKPGVSEFLDWVRILKSNEKKIGNYVKDLKDGKLPYPETLIKNQTDYITLFSRTNSDSKMSSDND